MSGAPQTPTARVDQALVARGLARSRRVAAELIRDGRVFLDGARVAKPSAPVTGDRALRVEGVAEPWVGRAAYKLLAALEVFAGVDPQGLHCIDVGASTGGFTQVLLSRGASGVDALDVGHGQLAPDLGGDARVRDLPGVNIRDVVTPGEQHIAAHTPAGATVLDPAPLVVCDLSFISLRLVLDRLAALTRADGDLIALIKPQFEVGRERLGHAGVVRSAAERRRAVTDVLALLDRFDLHAHGLADSPVTGTNGNYEYLLWARHETAGKMADVPSHLDAIFEDGDPS